MLSGFLAPRLRDGNSLAAIMRISAALIALSAIGMILSGTPQF
jgi:hypothetical protein